LKKVYQEIRAYSSRTSAKAGNLILLFTLQQIMLMMKVPDSNLRLNDDRQHPVGGQAPTDGGVAYHSLPSVGVAGSCFSISQ